MKRVRGVLAAVVIAVTAVTVPVVAAPAASAGVPYTWLCGPRGNEYAFHTGSSTMVGIYVARYGWVCHGGIWRRV